MAVWAYRCSPCTQDENACFVSRSLVDDLSSGIRRLRVKIGQRWVCALVDRSRPFEVEGMLIHDAVAAEAGDCAECDKLDSSQSSYGPEIGSSANHAVLEATAESATQLEHEAGAKTATQQIKAAAISLQGVRLLVILVGLDLVQRSGEADMLIADLRSRFGDIPIVLMGQHEDGTPVYHGPVELTALVADLPIDKMPWKSYPIA